MTIARADSSQNGSLIALVHDHDGVGDAARFVDGFLVFGVEGVEGIEPAPQSIIHLRGLEGVEKMNGLPHAFAVLRTLAPA